MNPNKEELKEFKNESIEMLDSAESKLLSLEKNWNSNAQYKAVFQIFHNIKSNANLLGMQDLQTHMQHLENNFLECKPLQNLTSDLATYFLNGIDASRQIIFGKKINFDYSLFNLNPKAEPAPVQVAPFKSDNSKVLIIDDEVELVEILKDILREAGFEVAGFTSPVKAIQQITLFKPDVVLTDYNMPQLTGFEVLKKVREINPDLPVIYLSGHLSKETLLESLNHGIFGAIDKPFDHGRVITLCENAANQYKTTKLLNDTINFIYYQYTDLDQYLQDKGATKIREQMHSQFRDLIKAKRKLKFLRRSPGQL